MKTNIRNAVFAVLLGVFVTGVAANATTYTAPTYEQVGVTYAYYMRDTYSASI